MILKIDTFEDEPEDFPFVVGADVRSGSGGLQKVLIRSNGQISCSCKGWRRSTQSQSCEHIRELQDRFGKSRDTILEREKTSSFKYVEIGTDSQWKVRKWIDGTFTCSCYTFAIKGQCRHVESYVRVAMQRIAEAAKDRPKNTMAVERESLRELERQRKEQEENKRNWEAAFGSVPMPSQPAFKPKPAAEPIAVNSTGRIKRKFKL